MGAVAFFFCFVVADAQVDDLTRPIVRAIFLWDSPCDSHHSVTTRKKKRTREWETGRGWYLSFFLIQQTNQTDG